MLFEIDGTGGAVAFFRKKIGRDGSPSRQYLAAQLPLSAFLLTLAPDLKFPDQIHFLSIKKARFWKICECVGPPFLTPFLGSSCHGPSRRQHLRNADHTADQQRQQTRLS